MGDKSPRIVPNKNSFRFGFEQTSAPKMQRERYPSTHTTRPLNNRISRASSSARHRYSFYRRMYIGPVARYPSRAMPPPATACPLPRAAPPATRQSHINALLSLCSAFYFISSISLSNGRTAIFPFHVIPISPCVIIYRSSRCRHINFGNRIKKKKKKKK